MASHIIYFINILSNFRLFLCCCVFKGMPFSFVELILIKIFIKNLFFGGGGTPVECGSSQARGRVTAAAASLCHSHR